MHLSVIIPALNEEKHIRDTVTSVNDYLKSKSIRYEVIVVVNASTDRTLDIVRELSNQIPELEIIELPLRGKGLAVKTGMLKASGDYQLFMDADHSTNINHLDKMMPFFDKGYDVIIGSITVKGTKIIKGSEPVWRRLFGKLGNIFIQIVAVPGISDTQRGFKIFSAPASRDIFSRITIDHWGFDIEALALARKFKYKIKEVPVIWKNDPDSVARPRLGSYFEVLLETVKVRLNLITGKYK